MESFNDGKWRLPNELQLRLMVFSALTYGYTGFQYFMYEAADVYEHTIVDSTGMPDPLLYTPIAQINAEAFNIGQVLRFLRSTDIRKMNTTLVPRVDDLSSSAPGAVACGMQYINASGAFLVGFFEDDEGYPYFMLTDLSYGDSETPESAATTYMIHFDAAVDTVHRLHRETGIFETLTPVGGNISITLPGGTGELFKVVGVGPVVPPQAQLIIEHSGASDPNDEGWSASWAVNPPVLLAEALPLAPDAAPNIAEAINAWQIHSYHIDDPDLSYPGQGGSIEYKYVLTPEQKAQAEALGWILTATWRLQEEVVEWGSSNYIGVRLPTSWYQMRMGPGAYEERGVKFVAGAFGPDLGETFDLGPDDYYTATIIYDPGTDTAVIYAEGVMVIEDIAPWGGLGDTGEIRVYWGTDGAGDETESKTNYNAVKFYVGAEPLCGDENHPYPTADLNKDCTVGLKDLVLLAAHWLEDSLAQ